MRRRRQPVSVHAGVVRALGWAGTLLACLAGGVALAAGAAPVVAGRAQSVRLTVYEQGPALVGEQRAAALHGGTAALLLEGLPEKLVGDSLQVSAPGLSVDAESFDADNLTAPDVRQRALGRQVLLYPRASTGQGVAATLVGAGSPPIVRLHGHLQVIDAASPWRIAYPAALFPGAGGARALLQVKGKPRQALHVAYLTAGLSWHADYAAWLDGAGKHLSLRAFASVHDASGAAYPSARLRLVAGRIAHQNQPRPRMMTLAATSTRSAAAGAPQPLFEYYAYTLPERVDLADHATVRVPLMDPVTLAVRREYRVAAQRLVLGESGAQSHWRQARVILHLKNTTHAPLPAGQWRLYTRRNGAPALLADLSHDSVAAGAGFSLDAGHAFDVTARRRQMSYERVNARTQRAGWRVEVRNAKQRAVTVRIVEPMPGSWSIEAESAPHERVDAHHVAWRLRVPAGGKAQLTYRVRWQ